jgi:transcriptional regulator with XRE-family HTH domain
MSPPSLRSIRKSKGISLKQASDRARIDKGHLSRCERGKAVLSLDALYRLATVLEVDDLEIQLRPYVRERAS